MHRSPLIAANWKMYPIPEGALAPDSAYRPRAGVETLVFATFLDLTTCIEAGLPTGAQCGHPEEKGAHTGDVSMAMLKKIGCAAVLCGHSERRKDHGEEDRFIAEQADAASRFGLHPVVCVGETETERKSRRHKSVVERQIKALPHHLMTIAYEPVWSIGTGVIPSLDQIQEMHAFIRSLLPPARQKVTRILYGGSLKPDNAEGILALPDVDGGLVGGASLKPESFAELMRLAQGAPKK